MTDLEKLTALRNRMADELATSEAVGAALNRWLDFGLAMFSELKRIQGNITGTIEALDELAAELRASRGAVA